MQDAEPTVKFTLRNPQPEKYMVKEERERDVEQVRWALRVHLPTKDYTVEKLKKQIIESITLALYASFKKHAIPQTVIDQFFKTETKQNIVVASLIKKIQDGEPKVKFTLRNPQPEVVKVTCNIFEIDMDKIFVIRNPLPKCKIAIKFSPELAYKLGETKHYLMGSDWISHGAFKNEIDLKRATQHSFLLHCDVIEPTVYDQISLPLLRVLPLNKTSLMYHNDLFISLQWKGIICGKNSKIHFWITTDRGEKIPIKEDVFIIIQIQ